MRLFHWLRRGLATLGLAAMAGGAAAAPAPSAVARPALWRIADADTTIYLFGTIHMLPPNYAWRSAAFDKALAKSDGLVVETKIDETNLREFQMAFSRLGTRAGLPPILERVPPEKRAALAAAIAASGRPMAEYDRMESWAAALILVNVQLKTLGIAGENGVETTLRNSFARTGKPIGELESNTDQLGFFDRLSEVSQRALLEGAIEQPAAMKGQFDAMLKAWTAGDTKAIARSFNAEMADSPELRDALLDRRNANWARWVERRMAQPGSVMVAVGAGHLAGDNSVQDMLQRRGYRVTRLQ